MKLISSAASLYATNYRRRVAWYFTSAIPLSITDPGRSGMKLG